MTDSFAQLRQQLRAMRIDDDQASNAPEEPTLNRQMNDAHDSNHSPEALVEDEWLHYLPDGLTDEARMHYWMLEQARLSYLHNDFSDCHERCAELLSLANLPKLAHVLTLHLISGVVPIYLGQHMLQDALDMCEKLEEDQGKNGTIDLLRDKTKALIRADLEEFERSRQDAEESRVLSEGAAEGGGTPVGEDDEDVMMVDGLQE